ncbi:hypothetical protein GQ53DRAFT_761317 [Thozetella sp. PMI_491]|nr:hypothetical protein GQ53DRAFT_761317 [Thozetella sp. PMI_491]
MERLERSLQCLLTEIKMGKIRYFRVKLDGAMTLGSESEMKSNSGCGTGPVVYCTVGRRKFETGLERLELPYQDFAYALAQLALSLIVEIHVLGLVVYAIISNENTGSKEDD